MTAELEQIQLPPAGSPLVGSVWTVDKAVGHVMEAYGRSVAAILDIGHRLYEAKGRLPPGSVPPGVRPADRWRYPSPWRQVVDRLPFGERSAERYIQVYLAFGQLACSDPPHVAALPADVATLGMLAQLPVDILPGMVASGEIHVKLSRAEAQTLVSRLQVSAGEGGSREQERAPDKPGERKAPTKTELAAENKELREKLAAAQSFAAVADQEAAPDVSGGDSASAEQAQCQDGEGPAPVLAGGSSATASDVEAEIQRRVQERGHATFVWMQERIAELEAELTQAQERITDLEQQLATARAVGCTDGLASE
jgi:polyhydroxyalkanoate synthesis regulator phasin